MDERVVVALFRMVFGLAVVVLFLDHVLHAGRMWRDWRDARTLRNFVISLMLVAGSIALITTDLAFTLEPSALSISVLRFWIFVMRTTSLVGGIFLAWTWRRP